MSVDCAVSVLVTFYNQGECVSRALESVIAQKTSFPFEVLIGDDGSSDDTWDQIQEWASSYPDAIRAFRMSRDDGVVDPIARASRNRLALMNEARGDYLVFLDGDDFFPSALKLERQKRVLDGDSKLHSCAHNFEYVDEAGLRLSAAFPEGGREIRMSFASYWRACYLPASCFMFRRPSACEISSIDKSNFDDNTIIFSLARSGDVLYFGDIMFSYVQRDGSTWNDMDMVKRVLVNQRDCWYELTFGSEFAKASYTRHALEFVRLGLFSKRRLLEQEKLAGSLGLLGQSSFLKMWSSLTSSGFARRLVSRLRLLLRSIPYVFARVVAYCGILRKTRAASE